MSDVSGGNDWWLASDGKWYPPASKAIASNTPPPPPPPQGAAQMYVGTSRSQSRISAGLSGTLQGFMWAGAGTSLLVALVAIGGIGALDSWYNGSGSASDVRAIDNALNGAIGLQIIIALVIFVLIIIWSHRAYVVAEGIGITQRSLSSGWAIGAWFIPIGNAVLPRLVLRDIEKAAAESVSRTSNGQTQAAPPIAIGWIWWVLFVVFNGIYLVGYGAFDDVNGDYDTWQLGYILLLVGGAGLTVASVLGALYIRGLTRSVNQTAEAGSA